MHIYIYIYIFIYLFIFIHTQKFKQSMLVSYTLKKIKLKVLKKYAHNFYIYFINAKAKD